MTSKRCFARSVDGLSGDWLGPASEDFDSFVKRDSGVIERWGVPTTDRWYVSASPGPQYAHRPGRAQGRLYRWQGQGPWQALGGGLPEPLDNMVYALAAGADCLFAGLIDGEVYVSRDRGDVWTRLEVGGDRLPGITALVIAEAAA